MLAGRIGMNTENHRDEELTVASGARRRSLAR